MKCHTEPTREAEPAKASTKRAAIVYTVVGAGAKEAVAGKPAKFEVRKYHVRRCGCVRACECVHACV